MTIETLAAEFTNLYRATKIAQGLVCSNLEVAVRFATEAMVADCLRSSDPLALLADEVDFQRECLERLAA